jgi:serine/threonine protein kinase
VEGGGGSIRVVSSTESHDDATLVDPLREAAPGKASVAAALFGGDTDGDAPVTIGRYVVRDRLGVGGMGAVYRAHDPELDREVALKVLLPDVADDEDARARMVREARALAKLSHPNVIGVYDVGRHGAEVFLAMELVDGSDLSAWLAAGEEGTGRPWRDVMDVFIQAARGLAAAHEQGLVHRDFKPANVLLGRDGRVRVVDFGLARPVDASAMPLIDHAPTRTGAILGTPMYMAPEQLEGKAATGASDQFALCVSLYMALYGDRPFAGATMASYVSQVIAGNVIEPASGDVPNGVYRALHRGLSTDPDQRWPTLEALITELNASLDASVAVVTPSAGATTPAPGRGIGVGAIVLVVAGLAGVAGLAWWGGSSPSEAADTRPVAAAPAAANAADSPGSPAGDATGATPAVDSPGTARTETGGAEVESAESGGRAPSAEPEQEPSAEPEPESTPTPPPARAREWCSFHEDTYALVDRGTKRRKSFTKRGKCWTCRKETSKSRIARLSPRDCGGYQMCTPSPEEACK